MPWEDDEPEDQSGPVAVARALSGSDEADTPDEMPDTLAPTQSASQDYVSPSDVDNDDSMWRGSEAQPAATQQHPAQDTSSQSPEDSDLSAFAGSGEDEQPIRFPDAPTIKPYSTAPVEAAQQLAQEKGEFADKVAAGDYKPSVGRRIAAALSAGMVGYKNPSEGETIGQGVLKAPLNRAQQAENTRESSTQADVEAGNLANQQTQTENQNAINNYRMGVEAATNQARARNFNAQAAQRRAQADAKNNEIVEFTPTDPSNPYKGGVGKTADGRTVQNTQPPDKWIQAWVKTPDGQTATAKMQANQRAQVADQAGLKGDARADFIATGKIQRAANVRVPSAEESRYSDWKTQFKKDNGRDPSAAEIQSYSHQQTGALPPAQARLIEQKKDDAINKSRQTFESSKETDADKEQYLDDWQAAQDEYEQSIAAASNQPITHVVVRDNVDPKTLQWHGQAPPTAGSPAQSGAPAASQPAQRAPAPATQPQQPPAATQQQPSYTARNGGQKVTVGTSVKVGQRAGTVTGFDAKGKPIVKWGQ